MYRITKYKDLYVDTTKLETLLPRSPLPTTSTLSSTARHVSLAIKSLKSWTSPPTNENTHLLSTPIRQYNSTSTATTTNHGLCDVELPLEYRPFVDELLKECKRVEATYETELHKLSRRELALRTNAAESWSTTMSSSHLARSGFREECVVLYREMRYLECFVLNNYSLVAELFRKHAALRFTTVPKTGAIVRVSLRRCLRNQVEQFPFTAREELLELMASVCNFYAKRFCDGHQHLALYELLAKKNVTPVQWESVLVGFLTGASLIVFVWALKAADKLEYLPGAYGGIRVFRLVFCVLFAGWLFGSLLYFLRETRVNFVLLLGIQSSSVPSCMSVFRPLSKVTLLFSISSLYYVRIANGHFGTVPTQNASFIPLAWVALFALWALYRLMRFAPTPSLGAAKQTLLLAVGLARPSFRVAFVADLMTSCGKVFVDMAYITCFALQGRGVTDELGPGPSVCKHSTILNDLVVPVILCYPLFLRLCQNLNQLYLTGKQWPFLANSFKYALNHSVVIFATLHQELMRPGQVDANKSVWQTCFLVSFALVSLMAWCWDVVVDWGLGDTKHGGLRRRRMCHDDRVYYLAMICDFFLRYIWTTTLIPVISTQLTVFAKFPLLFTTVELLRRTCWSFFRMENEHLHNTRGYRDVDFVPLYFDSPVASKPPSGDQPRPLVEKVGTLLEAAMFLAVVIVLVVIAVII